MSAFDYQCKFCNEGFDSCDSVTFACKHQYHLHCPAIAAVYGEALKELSDLQEFTIRDSPCHECLRVCANKLRNKNCKKGTSCCFNHDKVAVAFCQVQAAPRKQRLHPRLFRMGAGNIPLLIDADIKKCFSQAQTDKRSKQDLISGITQHLENIAASVWPGAMLELHGSRSSGYCIPDSDLNYCIGIGQCMDGTAITESLHYDTDYFRSCLQSEDSISDPLIVERSSEKSSIRGRCVDDSVGIEVSICSINEMLACRGRNSLLSKFASQYPSMIPMVLYLKQNLRDRFLNGSRSEGLSSTSLTCIVATYLIHTGDGGLDNLGSTMVKFLEFHANANYATLSISVQSGYTARAEDGAPLFVQDPFAGSLGQHRNLGEATRTMEPIKAMFSSLLHGEQYGFRQPPKDEFSFSQKLEH
jgi:hypothetical protein